MNESNSASDSNKNSSEPPVLDLCTCPQCGATGLSSDISCWLCHSPREQNPYAVGKLEPATSQDGYDALLVSLTIGCVGLSAIVVIGLGTGAPGLIVLLLLAAVPAFAIALPQLNRRSTHGRVGARDIASTVVLSLALTVGVIVLVIVAAVALLFVVCLFAVSYL